MKRLAVSVLFLILLLVAGCGGPQNTSGQQEGGQPATAENNTVNGAGGQEQAGTEQSPGQESDYPNKAVRIIVQSGQGGSIDTTARLIADFASKKWGQPVVVENMPGAGGRVAWTHIFNSDPDGYMLGTVNVPSLQLGEVLFSPEYKSSEFTYVYGYVRSGHVLVVREDSPIEDLDDFVERIENQRVTIGTFGNGSSGHLQAAAFIDHLGMSDNAGYVHFEGSAPQATALLGGDIDAGIFGYGTFTSTDGVRGLTTFAEEKTNAPKLMDVPLASELGYEQVPLVEQIFGLVGAPGIPDEILDRWVELFDEARNDDTVVDGFSKRNFEVGNLDPDRFRALADQVLELSQRLSDVMK